MKEIPIYKQATFWAKNYGASGIPDQKAVELYMECETTEAVNSLRNELIGISHSNFEEKSLDMTIGRNRVARHGSYEAWAKLMIMWMASYKA